MYNSMYVVETLKKTFEQVTGIGKPRSVALRGRKTHAVTFTDDGVTPNNAKLPLVYYPSPVRLARAPDPAAIFEALFESNGWKDSWRDGIFDYLHYHSGTHEVLGIARGRARVKFGGRDGKIIELHAADVAILPAGTGHQRISASRDLLVVGAYPPGGRYDECTESREEYEHALRSIPEVRLPAKDPVYGA